ncbi:MAG: O-antigen ligase family protein [Gammaproteobacteria bacterium]|nr:O-antigen ligase family protein [Gammaproteobacteria bacterium]
MKWVEGDLHTRGLSLLTFLYAALLQLESHGSLAVAVVLLLYALSQVGHWRWSAVDPFGRTFIYLLLLQFVAAVPIFLHSGLQLRLLEGGGRYLVLAAVVVVLASRLRRQLYSPLLGGVVVTAFVGGGIALYQYYLLGYERALLYQGAIFASLIAVVTLLTLGVALPLLQQLQRWRRVVSLLWIAALMFALFTLFATGTKSAIVTLLVVSWLMVFLLLPRLGHRWRLLLLLVALLPPLLAYKSMPIVEQRIDNAWYALAQIVSGEESEHTQRYLDYSTVTRYEQMKFGFLVLRERPWSGMTDGERVEFYQQLVTAGEVIKYRHLPERGWGAAEVWADWQQDPEKPDWGHAHNEWLEMGASKGILGVVALLLLYLLPFRYFFSKREDPSLWVRVMARNGVVLVLAYFVFGWTEIPLQVKTTAVLYTLFITLLWASIRVVERGQVGSQSDIR